MPKFSRFYPFSVFSIWEPRYHDNKVLLDADKVNRAKSDYLKIVFTKGGQAIKGTEWVITRRKAREFAKETNGTIKCYAIPMEYLEPLIIETKDLKEVW